MKKINIIIIIIMYISLSYGQYTYLKLINSFPDPKSEIEGDFLAHPFDVVWYGGSYFVTDARENCIKVFDESGKFKRQIGKKGQGPGELSDPFLLTINNKNGTIYCSDRGNGRISIFTFDGKFKKIIRAIMPIYDLEYIKGKIYTASYNKANQSLYTVYDTSGVLVNTFGDFFVDKINEINLSAELYKGVILDSFNDSLYSFYRYMPYINVFSKNGEFIRTINVDVKAFQNKYNDNISAIKNGIKNGMLNIQQITYGSSVKDNMFFRFSRVHGNCLVAIDFQGKLDRIFLFKDGGDKKWYRFIRKKRDKFIFVDIGSAQVRIYEEIKTK